MFNISVLYLLCAEYGTVNPSGHRPGHHCRHNQAITKLETNPGQMAELEEIANSGVSGFRRDPIDEIGANRVGVAYLATSSTL